MKKKARIILVLNFVIVISLLSFVPTSRGESERDWLEGDIETYGIRMYEDYSITNLLNNLSGREFRQMDMDYVIELLDVNQITYEHTYNASSVDGIMGSIVDQGAIEEFADDMINNMLNFEYQWDEDTNTTKLTDFSIQFEFYSFFVEPDWDAFNLALIETLNRDRIIASVAHDSTTTNITFGDFLDSLTSYQFSGIEGFPGYDELIDPTTEWTFEFDLNTSIYDHSHHYLDGDTFTLYNKYNVSYELAFTEGGTLEKSRFSTDASLIEYEEESGEICLDTEFLMLMIRGGLEALETPLNFYSAIIALLIVPVIVYSFKRKKK